MSEKLDYFNKFTKPLESFLGFDIAFYEDNGAIKEEYKLPNNILETQTATLKNLIQNSIGVIENYYEKGYDLKINQIDYIIEEIALCFINLKSQIDENMYLFLQNLKEISNKTYETAPTSLSFIKENQTLNKYLGENKVDILTFDEPMDLDKFILDDKKTLKLIDGLSLSIMLNDEYKVCGLLRKSPSETDIRSVILNEKEFEKVLMESLLKTAMVKKPEFQITGNDLKSLRERMLGKAEEVIERTSYVEINNRNINWYMTPSVYITTKNGKWAYKNFYILKGYILEHLYLSGEIDKGLNDNTHFTEIIEGTSIFIDSLQRLSSKNIGALFIFLNSETTIPQITRSAIDHYPQILRKNEQQLNILTLDKYLFELISSVDGAVFLNENFEILDFGKLIDTKSPLQNIELDKEKESVIEQGARTMAAKNASYHGLAIKVSEDGDIGVYKDGSIVLRI